MSFLLDVKENGKHVFVGSAFEWDVADRIRKTLIDAGFVVTLKQQPAAVELKDSRDE